MGLPSVIAMVRDLSHDALISAKGHALGGTTQLLAIADPCEPFMQVLLTRQSIVSPDTLIAKQGRHRFVLVFRGLRRVGSIREPTINPTLFNAGLITFAIALAGVVTGSGV
jgi:hypothetical protein